MSADQDWRLVADVETQDGGTLDRLVALGNGSDVALPEDAVVTHDGNRLFVYAGSRASADAARAVLEGAIEREDATARVAVTRWNDETGAWQQVEPPPTEDEARAQAEILRSAQRSETQTFVCKVGRWARRDLEQSMQEWAARLGLRCEIVEHAHFMTAQVAFTVTGPHHRVEEFRDGLRAESVSTMRSGAILGLEPL